MWEAAAVEKKKRQTGERDQLLRRRWKETEVAGRKRRGEGRRAGESRRPWQKYTKKAAVARSYLSWVTQFGEKSDSPFRTPGSTAHFFSNMWPTRHSTGEEGRPRSCGARQAGDWFYWTSPFLKLFFFFLFPRLMSWCQVTRPAIQRCAKLLSCQFTPAMMHPWTASKADRLMPQFAGYLFNLT